jgi:hypothetical protein
MPLCDEDMTPMFSEELLSHSLVYGCRSVNCRRYFSPDSGYFCALPQVMETSTEIASKEQSALLCPEEAKNTLYGSLVVVYLKMATPTPLLLL